MGSVGHNRTGDRSARSGNSMYAIVFDLDTTLMQETYPIPS